MRIFVELIVIGLAGLTSALVLAKFCLSQVRSLSSSYHYKMQSIVPARTDRALNMETHNACLKQLAHGSTISFSIPRYSTSLKPWPSCPLKLFAPMREGLGSGLLAKKMSSLRRAAAANIDSVQRPIREWRGIGNNGRCRTNTITAVEHGHVTTPPSFLELFTECETARRGLDTDGFNCNCDL